MSREETERVVFELLDRKDYDAAATETIKNHGAEIVRFLMAVLRDESEAGECFSIFSETFWKGLPSYRRECSLRTWCYMLARHAITYRNRDPHRRPDKVVPLSQSPGVANIVDKVRTNTLAYLKTETKDRFAELRRELDIEEQTLLVLRVDRDMSWNDIAQILLADQDADEKELQRKVANLRKQFQRTKDKLRKLAQEKGLFKKDQDRKTRV